MSYLLDDIDDYQNRLSDEQKKLVLRHCNRYDIDPVICAWYDDKNDFYSDWCDEIGYSKSDANDLLSNKNGNEGEFKKFKDGQIIRFVF